MLKKGIFGFLLMILLSVDSARAVDMDILVRNQRFSQDTFFFDIYLQRTGSENVFMCNSDFVLDYNEANFTNPQFAFLASSSVLFNAYGNQISYYDTNIGTKLESAGLNANKLMIFVQMPTYSNNTQFLERIAVIDNQELTHKLGTFYITGAIATNINPELSWTTSGDGLVVKINHRDSMTMEKTHAAIVSVDPVVGTTPLTQASNLNVLSKTNSAMTLSWTAGSGDGRILIVREGNTVNEFPVDGLTYNASTEFSAGDQISGSDNYVVYKGSNNSVTITGLSSNTTYHFALLEYTGENGHSENYLEAAADTLSETTQGDFIIANIKVFLQGAYNTGTGLMTTALRMGNNFGSTNLLPSAQPYSGSPWNYAGAENVDTANHPANAVDWVLVELRSTYNGAAVANGQAAGFLLNDGSIADTNGVDAIRFWNVNPGYYYVVVKHRNHLPVMSRDSVYLETGSTLYDFTNGGQSRAYGADTTTFHNTPMSVLSTGICGMRGGDAGGSVAYQVRYNGGGLNDRVAMLVLVGAATNSTPINNTYSRVDLNLDRQVRYNGGGLNDRVRLLMWVGAGTNSTPINKSIP